jgi:hypothetical protein
MVVTGTSRSILGQHDYVVEHDAILMGNRRLRVVSPQRCDKIFTQTSPTQKLCVRFDSIKASVRNGDHRGDHLVLAAMRGRSATSMQSSFESCRGRPDQEPCTMFFQLLFAEHIAGLPLLQFDVLVLTDWLYSPAERNRSYRSVSEEH